MWKRGSWGGGVGGCPLEANDIYYFFKSKHRHIDNIFLVL